MENLIPKNEESSQKEVLNEKKKYFHINWKIPKGLGVFLVIIFLVVLYPAFLVAYYFISDVLTPDIEVIEDVFPEVTEEEEEKIALTKTISMESGIKLMIPEEDWLVTEADYDSGGTYLTFHNTETSKDYYLSPGYHSTCENVNDVQVLTTFKFNGEDEYLMVADCYDLGGVIASKKVFMEYPSTEIILDLGPSVGNSAIKYVFESDSGESATATNEKLLKEYSVLIKMLESIILPEEKAEVEPDDDTDTETEIYKDDPLVEGSIRLGTFAIFLDETPSLITGVDAFQYNVSEEDKDDWTLLGDDIDNITDYYKIGTVASGDYVGYNVIFGFYNNSYYNDWYAIRANTLGYVLFEKDAEYTAFYDSSDILDSDIYIKESTKINYNPTIYTDLYTYDFEHEKAVGDSISIYKDQLSSKYTPSIVLDNGVQTYLSSESDFIYTEDKTGFMKGYQILPTFYNDSEVSVTWSVPEVMTNKAGYDYISIGGCGGNEIELADLNEEDLKITGKTSFGDNVYEFENRRDDEYLVKIYEEDYLGMEIYQYNDIDIDDETPLTFEETGNYHPVFYWKDPWGRFIKFASRSFIMTGGCAKPVVYLYPEEATDIEVKLDFKGTLTLSYPRYENGWKVKAFPNGNLQDSKGKSYDYLFWEGRLDSDLPEISTGWYIEKTKVESFLNKQLTKLGFNEKEKYQFVEYWLPQIQKENNKYVFITFIDESILDKFAPLEFSTKPDSYKRYFMLYEGVNTIKDVEEPEFEEFEREGFTVFEWGGAKID